MGRAARPVTRLPWERRRVRRRPLLEGAPLRPLPLLRAWLAENAPDGAAVDAEALTMVIGAAVMGLVSCRPMLAAGAGATAEDDDELLRRTVDVLVGVAAAAVGAGGEAPGSGVARPDSGHAA